MKIKTKMFKNIAKFFLLLFFLLSGQNVFASSDLHILSKELGYATYEFSVITNTDLADWRFEWSINDQDFFTTQKVRYFFQPGDHFIRLTAKSIDGLVKNDLMKLHVSFWSLKNNWFLWSLYFFAILLLFYYFLLKIYYLLNKQRVSKEARFFLEILDEHGWLERVIETRRSIKRKSKRTSTKKQKSS